MQRSQGLRSSSCEKCLHIRKLWNYRTERCNRTRGTICAISLYEAAKRSQAKTGLLTRLLAIEFHVTVFVALSLLLFFFTVRRIVSRYAKFSGIARRVTFRHFIFSGDARACVDVSTPATQLHRVTKNTKEWKNQLHHLALHKHFLMRQLLWALWTVSWLPIRESQNGVSRAKIHHSGGPWIN